MPQPDSKSQPAQSAPRGLGQWLHLHLPALLFGWFWFGMFLCGLLAPADRVALLESSVITQGWYLSAMSCLFGIPILVTYWLRMSGRWR